MITLFRRLALNLNLARHALSWRWLDARDLAAAYDDIAAYFDAEWRTRLQGVTDTLLERLPAELPPGEILDLGCGTGQAALQLAARHPDHRVVGVDVSPAMLEEARNADPLERVAWRQGEMQERLDETTPASTALIVATWSLGYARPPKILRAAAPALTPGGTIGFVVNRRDTLPGVFQAFRGTLRRFPGEARRALWPHFPKSVAQTRRWLRRAGFTALEVTSGAITVAPPPGVELLDWLEITGVLAGFDRALPLREPGPVRDDFRRRLADRPEPLEHRYVAAIARRPDPDRRSTRP